MICKYKLKVFQYIINDNVEWDCYTFNLYNMIQHDLPLLVFKIYMWHEVANPSAPPFLFATSFHVQNILYIYGLLFPQQSVCLVIITAEFGFTTTSGRQQLVVTYGYVLLVEETVQLSTKVSKTHRLSFIYILVVKA